ncbi:MAG: hypothetical protein K2N75_02330 [Helicobacter sp.]|uniref:hypothetical protein n=1 Tax=Helicobacter sp. TaxID=218 RepID=UPI0023C296F1|nr:hypothetical protein [Helicobacter sp.]MDE5926710.1 hypothetical protein [Helicobacter sp.]MDE7174876.1 hypothetical protein [Helicobacter sp.]
MCALLAMTGSQSVCYFVIARSRKTSWQSIILQTEIFTMESQRLMVRFCIMDCFGQVLAMTNWGAIWNLTMTQWNQYKKFWNAFCFNFHKSLIKGIKCKVDIIALLAVWLRRLTA